MADAPAPAQSTKSCPAILRRLAGMFYESLLLLAMLFVATSAYLAIDGVLDEAWRRPLLQLLLVSVSAIYFGWFWVHGGQTLPMRTWQMRLVSIDGGPVPPSKALARCLLAWVLIPAGGIAMLWALIDRDRRFLHDRLAGTRIIDTRV